MLTLQQFTFNPFSENTYILYSDKGNAFLIDPGCSTHSEEQQLRTFIAEKGLTIEKILLTHAHIDHVFGLQWACDTYACQYICILMKRKSWREILRMHVFLALPFLSLMDKWWR